MSVTQDIYTIRLEKPVHGGHVLGRIDGRVVFIRHGAPGELVNAVITDRGKVWRGEVVEVLEPHPQRIEVPWRNAGPGGVGAELAHLNLPAQREWKHDVIVDALQRIGKMELPVFVHAVDASDGWGYRTRIDLTTDDHGRASMFAYRSNALIPLTEMPLAHPRIEQLEIFSQRWPVNVRLSAVGPSADAGVVLIDGDGPPGHPATVWERVGSYEYQVDAAGFWQPHHKAPETLIAAVKDAVGDINSATVFDLYCGAGLFTQPLADWVGPSGRMFGVEGHPRAYVNARENTAHLDQARIHMGDVNEVLKGDLLPKQADVVVLDPPRVGARPETMKRIMAVQPLKIVYVSCDPAALARDLNVAAEGGYFAKRVEAYDLFPHTHHIESVVTLMREG